MSELIEALRAELKHARADNARLVAENKKLGEQVERLIAERDASPPVGVSVRACVICGAAQSSSAW